MRVLRNGLILGSLASVALTGIVAAQGPAPAQPQSVADKASYAIGLSFGRQFKNDAIGVSPEMMVQGLRDALAGKPPLVSDKDAQAAIQQFQEEVGARMLEQAKLAGERAKKEGPVFLATNGKKPDVKTTASGLQYKVLKQGNGRKPTKDDSVIAHYRGTFLDGKEFDSSYGRGEPATFPLDGVIPGWTEALQLMPIGSKWQLFVPYQLAYGEKGSPPAIPPYATLVFEVDLLDIAADQQEQVPSQPRVRIQQ